MEIKDFVKVYDNTLPKDIFQNLMRVIDTLEFSPSTIDEGETNFDVRRTYVKGLSNTSKSMTEVHWNNILSRNFSGHIEKYFKDLKTFVPVGGTNIIDVQLLKYENSGFYNYHVDHCAVAPRTMTCLMFLNTDYEGGELCFRDINGENEWCIEKAPTRMVVFPSTFLFPHTVKPVKGKRLSIVAWSL